MNGARNHNNSQDKLDSGNNYHIFSPINAMKDNRGIGGRSLGRQEGIMRRAERELFGGWNRTRNEMWQQEWTVWKQIRRSVMIHT